MARAVAFAGVQLDVADQGFSDIAGSVHKDAINALTALGVLNGTSATTYEPDKPVTRGQLASMGTCTRRTSTTSPRSASSVGSRAITTTRTAR